MRICSISVEIYNTMIQMEHDTHLLVHLVKSSDTCHNAETHGELDAVVVVMMVAVVVVVTFSSLVSFVFVSLLSGTGWDVDAVSVELESRDAPSVEDDVEDVVMTPKVGSEEVGTTDELGATLGPDEELG